MLDNTSKIADVIGKISKKQDNADSNIRADDTFGVLSIFNTEFLKITGSLTLTQRNYSTTSFVLDHPIYGELDSSTLEIDGGYSEGFGFPMTFPASFAESSSVIYTTTF